MTHAIFSRTDNESAGARISDNMYNLVIGLVLCWGFGVNWLMVQYIPVAPLQQINPFVFIIGFFACCLLGSYITAKSDSPFISFLGYNLIVVPFGTIVNLVVHQYDPALVLEAIQVTAIVTGIMMILGTIFPMFFRKISGALFTALIVVIIVEAVSILFFKADYAIIDWIVVIIFCGYIGVDWGRANAIPKTVDNAVDSAASLYMDIINLFLRILRIMGRNR